MRLGTSDAVVNLGDVRASKGKAVHGLHGKKETAGDLAERSAVKKLSLFSGDEFTSAFKVASLEDQQILVADGTAALHLGDNDNGLSDEEYFGSLLSQIERKLTVEEPDCISSEPLETSLENLDVVATEEMAAGFLSSIPSILAPETAIPEEFYEDAEGNRIVPADVEILKAALADQNSSARSKAGPQLQLDGMRFTIIDRSSEEGTATGRKLSMVELLQKFVVPGTEKTEPLLKSQPAVKQADPKDNGLPKEATLAQTVDPSLVEETSDEETKSVDSAIRKPESNAPLINLQGAVRVDAHLPGEVLSPHKQIAINIEAALANPAGVDNGTANTGPMTSLRIKLHPDHLGDVEVVIRRRGEMLEVTLKPEKSSTAALLTSDHAELARTLDLAAVEAGPVVVTIDNSSFRDQGNGERKSPQDAQGSWSGQQNRDQAQHNSHDSAASGRSAHQEKNNGDNAKDIEAGIQKVAGSIGRRNSGIYL